MNEQGCYRCLWPDSHLIKAIVLLSFTHIFLPGTADAADGTKFKISLGGYIIDKFETTVSLTDESVGVGATVIPAETLDLEPDQSVFRLKAQYRINDRHSITTAWYRISSDGNVVLDEELKWVDTNGDAISLLINANVQTELDYDIYKLGYLWSYYRTEKVELTAGAGLHLTRVSINLNASATSSDKQAKSTDSTVPLPVLSVGLQYHITPRLKWTFSAEAFSMSFDDWSGIYTDTLLGLEFKPFTHFGVGIGLGANSLNIEEENRDYKFDFDNRITGSVIYLTMYF